jgi:hypothetical protein
MNELNRKLWASFNYGINTSELVSRESRAKIGDINFFSLGSDFDVFIFNLI